MNKQEQRMENAQERIRAVYEYLKAFKSITGGMSPSVRDICEHMGSLYNGNEPMSTSLVNYYLDALVAQRKIQFPEENPGSGRIVRQARSIRLVGEKYIAP